MNLKDLDDKLVASFPHIKREVLSAALRVILDEIRLALEEGKYVKLHKFGNFEPVMRKVPPIPWLPPDARKEFAPNIKFTPSINLLAKLNNHGNADNR